jgi:predicted enzyme related to lactoylglutathione lyase
MTWQPSPYENGDLVVVIDCADLERAARFWAGALGYQDAGVSGPTYRSVRPADGTGPEILLQRTADAKPGKNRVHLDLRTKDLEAEVSRMLELGATGLTTEPVDEYGWSWHVLADPDGNEFCLLRPPDDYWDNRAG